MKIINKTNLRYAELGLIIDEIIRTGKEDTHYYGQVQLATVEFGSHVIKIQIRYLKKYVEWVFNE